MSSTFDRRKFAIIGNSIGGQTTAIALHDNGIPWSDIAIFERSAVSRDAQGGGNNFRPYAAKWLTDHGIDIPGISISTPKLRVVTERTSLDDRAHYDIDGQSSLSCFYADGDQQRFATTWNLSYSHLSRVLPEGLVNFQHRLSAVDTADDGSPIARFDNGSSIESDILIAADGGNSTVRNQIAPENAPQRMGYVAFRGLVPVEQLSDMDTGLFVDPGNATGTFTAYQGHHCRFIAFPVPANDSSDGEPRRVLINWNFYVVLPDGPSYDFVFGRKDTRSRSGGLLSPGQQNKRAGLTDAMNKIASELLPKPFAAMIHRTREPYAKDVRLSLGRNRTRRNGTVIFMGDAGYMIPPHTGQGLNNGMSGAIYFARQVGSLFSTDYTDTATSVDVKLNTVEWESLHYMRSMQLINTIRDLKFMTPAAGGGPNWATDPFGPTSPLMQPGLEIN